MSYSSEHDAACGHRDVDLQGYCTGCGQPQLCDAVPSELTAPPCWLWRGHPEPDHANERGQTWTDGGLVQELDRG